MALDTMPTDDYKSILRADKCPPGEQDGRFNVPTVDEVAVLISNEARVARDIVIQKRSNTLKRIS